MKRLTQAQYLNSVEDVFDAQARPTAALPLDNADEGFLSIGASFVSSTEGAAGAGVPLEQLGQTDQGFERWTRNAVTEIET